MCTYNGQRYLVEQLDSLVNQTHKNWEIWVSDDGSTDDTLGIVEHYQAHFPGKIHLYHGPRQGFAVNFLFLVFQVKIAGDYYAYADQDDRWEDTKLERALHCLENSPNNSPALYCSRTRLIDAQGQSIGYSPLFTKGTGFLNALVQNIAGGNTMVFNHRVVKLLQKTKQPSFLVTHDWWTYLLVTGAGGKVVYDPSPTVNYRQHQANLIGNNTGLFARLYRIKSMFQGHLKNWVDQHIQALLAIEDQVLTEENRAILYKFVDAKNKKFIINVFKTKQLGIYRQTLLGNIGLMVSLLFKKI